MRAEKIEEFRDRFANSYVVADRGFVGAVIQPCGTRKRLIRALEMLETKRDENRPKSTGTYRYRRRPWRCARNGATQVLAMPGQVIP
jgi:acetyl-CoA carboxylase carboxyltransferase component